MRKGWLSLWLMAALAAGAARAQQDEDGPGRGVARLSVINGDVSVRRGDSGDWVAGAINAPLVVQDRVMTGPGSRAEVQFDWANMVRLAANTEVRLAELEHRRYQVELARGAVMLRVLRDTDAEIEVNTPSVSVRPAGKGSYRVTVTEQGQTEITARSGEAEIYTPTGVERLRSGRTMLVRGAPSSPEFRTVEAIARDGFDQWSESRDRYLERTRSYSYVSRDIYGADELDYYGRWVWVAPYGWVWTPFGVASWWAPYRHGRWVWIDWYGWSWLSYDPWGWAPFHYGRWFWQGPYGWCWYPGPRHYRHYWRPALVAFFGFHVGGVHVGFGFGRVGWVPLAPYEPFYPWYGPRYYGWYRQPTYIDNSVRIVNNVQIVNVYRNARVVNAVSGVDHDGFVRGGRIQPIRVGEGDFQRASLVQGPLPVVPGRESVRFADRPVQAGNLPRGEAERFFSRRPAAPVERVSFEEQRRGMEQVVRRTFSPPAEGPLAGSVRAGQEPARGGQGVPAPGLRTESGNLPRGGSDVRIWRAESEPGNLQRGAEERGWRRLGEPARTDVTNLPRGGAEPASGAEWRRIGEPVRTESGNLPRQEATDSGQWRRFSGADRGSPGAPAAGDARGWRRFGEPMNREAAGSLRTAPEVAPGGVRGAEPVERRPAAIPRQSDEGWRRFSSPRSEPFGSDSGGARMDSPRSDRWRDMTPRSEPRQFEGRRGGEPIFINPPIVRERVAPRFEGGGRATPEMRSAPEARGGGMVRGGEAHGGGQPRGEGRGGGMSRSAEGGGRVGRPR